MLSRFIILNWGYNCCKNVVQFGNQQVIRHYSQQTQNCNRIDFSNILQHLTLQIKKSKTAYYPNKPYKTGLDLH